MIPRFGLRASARTVRVIFEMALCNLLANRTKSLIVGGVVGLASLFTIVGGSILDAVDRAVQSSITGSIAGHIQVYSAESKDPLRILGDSDVDVPDLAPIHGFASVKRALLAVPNVAAVVPMGFGDATVASGNTIDEAARQLREGYEQRRDFPSADAGRRYEASKERAKHVVELLSTELRNTERIDADLSSPEVRDALARVNTPSFWEHFDTAAMDNIEFLENRIAPLGGDGETLSVRYVGTDPAHFARAFSRMHIVDGGPIPEGERGFLFSKLMYEQQVKLKAASGLDYIERARERSARIAGDSDLERVVEENALAVNEILAQLDAIGTNVFRQKLQKLLGSSEEDVGRLLDRFFRTDDANFDRRYDFFYRELGPRLKLYRIGIGDVVTLRTTTRGGYVRTANVKLWGTYEFRGLERSPQAGSLNMIDLVTFRDLYGFVTAESEKELDALRASSGAPDVRRENVEDELFGKIAAVETSNDAQPGRAEAELAELRGTRARRELDEHRRYDARELEDGDVLDAAVLLKDEKRIAETIRAIETAGKRSGLMLKAVSWEEASGLVGEFVTLLRAVLFAAVTIIFIVVLVVVNNALVMATLDRVRELGALRAIGAQRSFVLGMVLVEATLLGGAAGLGGAALGSGLLLVLRRVGITATNDVMTFFFAGPKLSPSVSVAQFGFALALVTLIALVSGIYPAWLATRVSPKEAMQAEE